MAPKRRLRSNTSLASSDEDNFSDFQVAQRPTKNPLAPAPADQESDGSDGDYERGAGNEVESSDEIGEDGVLTKRQPPPKRMAAAELPTKNVASPEASPLKRKTAKSPPRRKKTGKVAAPAAEMARPPPLTRNEAAAQRARSPSPEKAAAAADTEAAKSSPPKKAAASEAAKSPKPKKAAASEAAKSLPPKEATVAATTEAANSPQPKKAAARTEVAGTPPSTGSADETTDVAPSPEAAAPAGADKDLPQPQEDEYDAEKHFKEKILTYWYLWQMVLTLEEEHSLSFKGAFLKIDDTKASILNTKLKKMRVQEMKQQVCWMDTDKEVTQVLANLIK